MDIRTDRDKMEELGRDGIPQSRIDQDQIEQPGVVGQMYDGWLDRLFEKEIEEKRASTGEY